VDRIGEALEDAQDERAADLTARDEGVAALERQVERIEARLDRLLALVEGLNERQRRTRPDASASAAPPSASNGTGATRAHKPSTTRNRRKPAGANS
jgi:molecular chaperone GrpE (heat shock protein)